MTERLKVKDDLELIRASSSDVDEIWTIISSNADWLAAKGLNHWKIYYTREKIEKKINLENVYLVQINGESVGTLTLDTSKTHYPPEVLNQFAEPVEDAIYVTALGILPESHGQGIASKLMEFVDRTARDQGIKYVRFDCREDDTLLVNFYNRRGYNKVGEVVGQNGVTFLLMEKKVL